MGMARQVDKLYQAMKGAAKERKIHASPQHDLYWRKEPYFFSASYFWKDEAPVEGKVALWLDISVKYCRFDELQFSITDPGKDFQFTDKVRANSQVMCRGTLPRLSQAFPWDGSEETLPELCGAVIDWITAYQLEFIQRAEREYGGLDEFYLAHEEAFPLMAGLTYVERGAYADAERCFHSPQMDYENLKFSVHPETEEQKGRLVRYGYNGKASVWYRDIKTVLADYAAARERGLEWNEDLRNFGLPL